MNRRVFYIILCIFYLLTIFICANLLIPVFNVYISQKNNINVLEKQINSENTKLINLTKDLDNFNNNDYIQKEARKRLFMVMPGEKPFFVLLNNNNNFPKSCCKIITDLKNLEYQHDYQTHLKLIKNYNINNQNIPKFTFSIRQQKKMNWIDIVKKSLDL